MTAKIHSIADIRSKTDENYEKQLELIYLLSFF